MLNDLKDIISFEVDDLMGNISGMGNLDEDAEKFIHGELSTFAENISKLSYSDALNDMKNHADKLRHEAGCEQEA